MTRETFEAIKARVEAGVSGKVGQLRVVVICVDAFGEPADPDAFTPEIAAEFRTRAQSLADAVKDREALVKWIEDGFDIEWFDKPKTAVPS